MNKLYVNYANCVQSAKSAKDWGIGGSYESIPPHKGTPP